MFIGEYNFTVDAKNRIAIPAKFRDLLGKVAVVTHGLDSCLFIHPRKEWAALAKKVAALPLNQANSRAFTRLMLAGAMDIELDGQGRFVLPDYLRRYAMIKRKVIIAGLYNRLEIWSEERWNRYKKQTEKNGNDIAEKLGELAI